MAVTKVSSMVVRMVACWVVMKAALKVIWSVAHWVASMEIQLVVLMAAQTDHRKSAHKCRRDRKGGRGGPKML